MVKPKTKKQILIKKTAGIAGLVTFGLIAPNIMSAKIGLDTFPQYRLVQEGVKLFLKGTGMTPMAIAESILVKISEYIFSLLNLLVKLGGIIFDAMLNIGFTSHLDVVKAGWQITRDFGNMFFILFLAVIAFATILRIEKYGIKELLPKIIIIALLINFSLVICSAIIDFSNITANFFIKDIKKYTSEEANKKGVSATLTDSLRLTKIYQPIECDGLSDEPGESGKSALDECIENAEGKFTANMITFVISMTMGSLVMLVATFTFFAGAILLLIRVVIVWFLVMLVPLVFLCYIMPALRQNWQKWWKSFLQWCLFAPAYAFFIWLAVKVAVEGGTLIVTKKLSTEFTGMGAFVNAFTSSPALIIHYLFIIALLLGGLIAAQKFGFYGADTAMKIGKGIYKGTARWTGARIRERMAKPAAGLAGGLARTFGRVPGLRKLALAPAQVMAKQQEGIDKEKKKLSVYTPDTLKSLYPSFRGNRSQQVAMAEILAEKNSLKADKNLSEKDIGQLVKLSELYGKSNVLLKNRPDLAPTIGKSIKEVFDKIKPADVEKLQTEAFKEQSVQDEFI
ncbi:MAG: hypothetical protein ISS88_03370, partial [Candidatus Portnoybacteria bacterium]|nr:hypothetical protein [Candidatus Portnoybacteria bacterium]